MYIYTSKLGIHAGTLTPIGNFKHLIHLLPCNSIQFTFYLYCTLFGHCPQAALYDQLINTGSIQEIDQFMHNDKASEGSEENLPETMLEKTFRINGNPFADNMIIKCINVL